MGRPMTTGEACLFMREFLSLGDKIDDPAAYTCHSAKSTILSWMAKSNLMDFDSRRLLGHHLGQGVISTLTYSRNGMGRLQHNVHQVLQLIKTGEFAPGLPRVERLRNMVGIIDGPESDMPAGEDEE